MELRTIADWEVRQRLLAVTGVSQVSVMGGEMKQYQVLTSPERLSQHDVTLDELTAAVEKSNIVTGGGFLLSKTHESLIRIIGRATTLDEVADTVVRAGDPVPITVREVAEVRYAGPVRRGDASIDGERSIILSVQKQPGADTLALTDEIESTLADIQQRLPNDVVISTDIFKQADFIDSAIDNVKEAIRDGVIWVIVVLFIFLWNLRTSLITLTAIPLSIIITALAFSYFGISINTMTLGGLAVAIGELVDDSIVDIENIFRRLKENRQKPTPDNPLKVIFLASCEVRNSIVYATLDRRACRLPALLAGRAGRPDVRPAGARLSDDAAGLARRLAHRHAGARLVPAAEGELPQDGRTTRCCSGGSSGPTRICCDSRCGTARPCSRWWPCSWRFPSRASSGWVASSCPGSTKGSLTITAIAPPGVSMEESNRIAGRVERMLSEIPEVKHVSRRTGRAELDEHAENVNFSEIDVGLIQPERPKPGIHYAVLRAIPGLHGFGVDEVGRSRDEVMAEIRDIVAEVPGVKVNIGQPISHRLDHMMSGIRSQIAVKLFGRDIEELRDRGQDIAEVMTEVPGVVDLQIEPQVDIPQVRVTIRRQEAARYGLAPADVAKALETALQGRTVSQVLEEQRVFDLVVWFDEEARNDLDAIRSTLISTPDGSRVALGTVADVIATQGPNTINRENVQRRIVMQCNTAGRDLVSVVHDIQARRGREDQAHPQRWLLHRVRRPVRGPAGRQSATAAPGQLRRGGHLSAAFKCLASWRAALQVMVNIPLAAIGSVIALLLVNRPVRGGAGRSVLVGGSGSLGWSIGPFGRPLGRLHHADRHRQPQRHHDDLALHPPDEVRGRGLRRADDHPRQPGATRPVLMTALTTIIGLVPLALGAGQTGKEILHPLAIVVIGGLLSLDAAGPDRHTRLVLQVRSQGLRGRR